MITGPDEVNREEYWRYRLSEAQKMSQLHYSVYLTRKEDWQNIEKAHREIISKEIPLSARVLDAGCGYGRGFEMLSPREYVGVDFSPDFISKAKELYAGDFRVGDLANLPFKKGEFDWAVCISIKQMIIGKSSEEHWKKMEKELRRVAKKILILEYTNPEQYEISG